MTPLVLVPRKAMRPPIPFERTNRLRHSSLRHPGRPDLLFRLQPHLGGPEALFSRSIASQAAPAAEKASIYAAADRICGAQKGGGRDHYTFPDQIDEADLTSSGFL